MGKVIVPVRMWNFSDEQAVLAGRKSLVRIRALIDTGATTNVLSDKLAARLGLVPSGMVRMVLADGRSVPRPNAFGLRVAALGRSAILRAIIDPSRKIPLLGQIFLEDTCLLVDCKHQRLIRDPAYGGEEAYEVFRVVESPGQVQSRP